MRLDRSDIYLCAQLSEMAYCDDSDVIQESLREDALTFIGWYRVPPDLEFFVAIDPARKIVYCAIRGTDSWRDVITDVRAVRRPLTLADGETRVWVHGGGLQASRRIAGTIATQLRARPWDDVIFTGHSLGGMIAQILAVMMPTRYGVGDRKISTITFGQPRAGCRRFARALNALDGTHVRAYHRGDPVPWLPGALSRPTPWPRYVHAGEPMAWPCSSVGIAAHKMAGYLADAAALR